MRFQFNEILSPFLNYSNSWRCSSFKIPYIRYESTNSWRYYCWCRLYFIDTDYCDRMVSQKEQRKQNGVSIVCMYTKTNQNNVVDSQLDWCRSICALVVRFIGLLASRKRRRRWKAWLARLDSMHALTAAHSNLTPHSLSYIQHWLSFACRIVFLFIHTV